jgi:hypothetical protein
MNLTDRFRHALKAGRDAVTSAGEAPTPTGSAVAALVIGPGTGEMAAAHAWLRTARQGRAILITDQTGVGLYRDPGHVTEFLPTGDWSEGNPARSLYVRRRLAIIFTKWEVIRCAAIGPEAERLFAAVSVQGGAFAGTTSLEMMRPS